MSDVSLLVADEYLKENYFLSDDYEGSSDGKTEKKIKFIKVIFCVLCFALLCELVIYKYIMPSFSSPKVTVTGQKEYSAEEIARLLLPMNSTSWFDFDVEQAVALLSSEAGIDHVSVEKKFPDKIYVNVTEREPVAVTFVMDHGCTAPVQIDKNGVLFPAKKASTEETLPIVSGLPVEYMSKGMRIPAKYRPLIDQISKISEMPQHYFASISEICVLPKDSGNYELALIPSQSKIKVLTDRALNEDALKYMLVVLDVVNQIGTDNEVSAVDLRYGSVSYITR